MIMNQSLVVKPAQQAGLAPALQTSNAILQMTLPELVDRIREEIDTNPFVEEKPAKFVAPSRIRLGSGNQNLSSMIDMAAAPCTLRDRLIHQISFLKLQSEHRDLAIWLVGMLDSDGYLRENPSELAELTGQPEPVIHEVINKLKSLEPVGVFARNLTECLMLQLRARNLFNNEMAVFLNALSGAGRVQIPEISQRTGLSEARAEELLRTIRRLSPRPAAQSSVEVSPAIQPDVYLDFEPSGGWRIEINDAILPRIALSSGYYAEVLRSGKDSEAVSYARQAYGKASWMIECVKRRSETLLRVSQCLVRRQPGFIAGGVESLSPMTLNDIAQELGLHLSTISRVTSNKYIATPRGVLAMKDFFSRAVGSDPATALTAHLIRARIRHIIAGEADTDPLPDYRIQQALSDQGIEISRRSVTKYRDQMKIPSQKNRSRFPREQVELIESRFS